jgi:Mn2+/Fe2+ NRAMP family transporter
LGDVNLWAVGIGFIAFMVLSTGRTPLIERVLVLLVAGMAAVFLCTAIITQPSIAGIASGLLTPSIPENAAMLVVGLIGTTVVPYNLFLHASAVKNHAISGMTLKEARQDIALSVVGGGLITLCIVITAAASLHGTGKPITSLSQIAPTLEPLMGAAAAAVLTVGFFAAGLSSAITAPLAAAYAVTEILALNEQRREQVFRWTWLLVLGVGVLFASFSLKPLQLILFAQVANGLLLPVCAAFILWIANDRSMLQQHTNTGLQNLSGVFVIAITLILGARSLSLAAGWL